MQIDVIKSSKLVDYAYSHSVMRKYSDIINQNLCKSVLWFLEHKSIYTFGPNCNNSDLLYKNNIPVYCTDRGGKFTYHGPGQRIVYAMINLQELYSIKKPDVHMFIFDLQQWIIRSLKSLNIQCILDSQHPGIWVEHNGILQKIASIGLRFKKWVSYHGIAININTDLSFFNAIIPCGIKDRGVNNINNIIGYQCNKDMLDQILLNKFQEVFGVSTECLY